MNKVRKFFRDNLPLKVGMIIILSLFFLIPLNMIRMTVFERQQRQMEAEREIMGLWGGRQIVGGPILAVPYTAVRRNDQDKLVTVNETLFILPQRLGIEARMKTQTLSRGIYEVPVYTVDLLMEGFFSGDSKLPPGEEIDPRSVRWNEAVLVVEIPDMRSLESKPVMTFRGKSLPLQTGITKLGIFGGGFQAAAPLEAGSGFQGVSRTGGSGGSSFSISMTLTGAGSMGFLPLGEQTEVSIISDWEGPSFTGSYLPDERELGDEGFTARWSILGFGRNYPKIFTTESAYAAAIPGSSFGFDLLVPVDTYLRTERSVKYGILFILLPFLVLFLFELFTGTRLHILQYLMIGAAQTVFYLLLLSIGEHLPYPAAYLISAAVTSGLVTFYSGAVLSTWKRSLSAVLPLLGGLYIFLYTAVNSEDYALLIGSLGLFVILAGVMIATRKIDWFAPRTGHPRRIDGE